MHYSVRVPFNFSDDFPVHNTLEGDRMLRFWVVFQRRRYQAITLISPKIESCPRSGKFFMKAVREANCTFLEIYEKKKKK